MQPFSGCGVYQKYGCGRAADSGRGVELQTPVDLPQNAASISQRFDPTIGPAYNDYRGFDILVPVLAAGDGEPAISPGYRDPRLLRSDGIGNISCFDRSRGYPASPVLPTCPVPCQGLAWP